MNRRFEICQRAFVPVDANDGAFVFASDGLKLVFDFGHDLYVDVIGIFVELKMQKSNLSSLVCASVWLQCSRRSTRSSICIAIF